MNPLLSVTETFNLTKDIANTPIQLIYEKTANHSNKAKFASIPVKINKKGLET